MSNLNLGHVQPQIISLSASANRLSNIQKQAEEYAALIMEELDPDNLGYIMVMRVLTVYYSTLFLAVDDDDLLLYFVTWNR